MMCYKNLFLLIALINISNSIFAMEIVKGKKYQTKDGQIVTIIGDCKEVFGVDSLETIGDAVTNPVCLAYLKTCVAESRKTLLATALAQDIASGNQAVLKSCLETKYRGTFYYAKGKILGLCVHPSWLTPVEEEWE